MEVSSEVRKVIEIPVPSEIVSKEFMRRSLRNVVMKEKTGGMTRTMK